MILVSTSNRLKGTVTRLLSSILLIALILSSCDLDKPTDTDLGSDTWYWILDYPEGIILKDVIPLTDSTFVLQCVTTSEELILHVDAFTQTIDTIAKPIDSYMTILRQIAASSDGMVFMLYQGYDENGEYLTVVKMSSDGIPIWETSIEQRAETCSIEPMSNGGCLIHGIYGCMNSFKEMDLCFYIAGLDHCGRHIGTHSLCRSDSSGTFYLGIWAISTENDVFFVGSFQAHDSAGYRQCITSIEPDSFTLSITILESLDANSPLITECTEDGVLLLFKRGGNVLDKVIIDDNKQVQSINSCPYPFFWMTLNDIGYSIEL